MSVQTATHEPVAGEGLPAPDADGLWWCRLKGGHLFGYDVRLRNGLIYESDPSLGALRNWPGSLWFRSPPIGATGPGGPIDSDGLWWCRGKGDRLSGSDVRVRNGRVYHADPGHGPLKHYPGERWYRSPPVPGLVEHAEPFIPPKHLY